jgi:hypothetical protein
MSWLWHGLIAPGNVTLLTSQWKAGKTPLLAALLAKLQTGGELAGLAVAPGKALLISEEGKGNWRRRYDRRGSGRSHAFGARVADPDARFHQTACSDSRARSIPLAARRRAVTEAGTGCAQGVQTLQ